MSKGELLIEITQQPGMPTYSTIWRWQVDRPDFRDLYARAREMQGHALADRAVMAARYATPEDAAAARLKFDADRWLAGKVAPKVYGDKVGVEHSGNLTLESLVTQSFQVAIESGEG